MPLEPRRREHRWAREHRVAVASAVIAFGAFAVSIFTGVKQMNLDNDQQRFEERVEERESAPVLAAGVPPETRYQMVKVSTRAGRLEKYNHRPDIDEGEDNGEKQWDLVAPVWNVGEGLAAIRSAKALANCSSTEVRKYIGEPLDPSSKRDRLGFYNVPSGLSEQLVYEMLPEDALRVLYDKTKTKNKEKSKRVLHVIVRYTDLLVTRDRWTCMTWAGKYWSLVTQSSGDQEPKFE